MCLAYSKFPMLAIIVIINAAITTHVIDFLDLEGQLRAYSCSTYLISFNTCLCTLIIPLKQRPSILTLRIIRNRLLWVLFLMIPPTQASSSSELV